ncbi:MAG: PQQ-binding-like beta-propeller repeat protein [Planctomycetota bacterium]
MKSNFMLARTCVAALLSVLQWLAAPPAIAGDWPQWRYDARRSADCPEALPADLHLVWSRQLPPPRPAWPKYLRMSFDASSEPVVMGETMFLPSSVTDSVTALDTETGEERWTFFAEGPVRFAPVACNDRIYFIADDGYLRCLDARTGSLVWRFCGIPPNCDDRHVLGNDRLISLYPARGGPALRDGRIYFGVGVFPFEGTCVHCVDAESGKVIWTNAELDRIPGALLDHQNVREGGISPQGYLTLAANKLFVPGGRAKAAVLDPSTGELAPYSSDWGGRQYLHKGAWYVAAGENYYFASGDSFELASGIRLEIDPGNEKELGEFREPVLSGNLAYYSVPINKPLGYHPIGVGYDRIAAVDLTQEPAWKMVENAQKIRQRTAVYHESWQFGRPWKVQIKAGSRLYGGAEGTVAAIEIPQAGGQPTVSWQAQIDGTPARMLAADDKLFVVTQEGMLFAFAARPIGEPRHHAWQQAAPAAPADLVATKAHDILKTSTMQEGYCVVLGAGDGSLAGELARQSNLQIIVIESDLATVERMRRRFGRTGLYGSRISVYAGDPVSYGLPPYLAAIVVCEGEQGTRLATDSSRLKDVFGALRPYGGTACFVGADISTARVAAAVESAGLERAEVSGAGTMVSLKRVGSLPGAAGWTHENADAGATLVSRDQRVKPPLAVLWFGGAVDELFPEWDFTHSRPPMPLVAGGRMFFQTFPKLHAVDVYTGRRLWTVAIPGIPSGTPRYNVNYVAAADLLYVAAGRTCYAVDTATGEVKFHLDAPGSDPVWQQVRLSNDDLLGTTGAVLACIDRHTGQTKWRHSPEREVAAFAAGNGRVFYADATLGEPGAKAAPVEGQIVALDMATGRPLWTTQVNLEAEEELPLHLAFSEANGLVLAARQKTTALRAADGQLLWSQDEIERSNLLILHPMQLFSQAGAAYDLATGAPLAQRLWAQKRRGCTPVIGAANLILIRDAFASHYDIHQKQTTIFRGIRVGCTNNLIAADGLLNAPNFAHGCSCNYSVYTSLAFVPLTELGNERAGHPAP